MYRDHCFCLLCISLFQSPAVHIKGPDIRLHKNRLRTGIGNSQSRSDKGIAGKDHLVAFPDLQGFERKKNGIQPIAHADAFFYIVILCKFFFKKFQLRPLNKPVLFIYFLKLSVYLIPDLIMHFFK